MSDGDGDETSIQLKRTNDAEEARKAEEKLKAATTGIGGKDNIVVPQAKTDDAENTTNVKPNEEENPFKRLMDKIAPESGGWAEIMRKLIGQMGQDLTGKSSLSALTQTGNAIRQGGKFAIKSPYLAVKNGTQGAKYAASSIDQATQPTLSVVTTKVNQAKDYAVQSAYKEIDGRSAVGRFDKVYKGTKNTLSKDAKINAVKQYDEFEKSLTGKLTPDTVQKKFKALSPEAKEYGNKRLSAEVKNFNDRYGNQTEKNQSRAYDKLSNHAKARGQKLASEWKAGGTPDHETLLAVQAAKKEAKEWKTGDPEASNLAQSVALGEKTFWKKGDATPSDLAIHLAEEEIKDPERDDNHSQLALDVIEKASVGSEDGVNDREVEDIDDDNEEAAAADENEDVSELRPAEAGPNLTKGPDTSTLFAMMKKMLGMAKDSHNNGETTSNQVQPEPSGNGPSPMH